MDNPAERNVTKTIDRIQERLATYACGLNYEQISAEAIHAAKVRTIDALGVLLGGFFGEPCRIVRNLAADMQNSNGATIIGTRMKTTVDMAAFVNGTTAHYAELSEIYSWPGSFRGHPSDVILPVLAAAEHAQVTGRDFVTSIVLAYEVYCRISDVFHNRGYDYTTIICLATAVAAGKLLGLSSDQLSHCISMAVVPNAILKQARLAPQAMYMTAVSGQAGRAGVFAALLARAGMEGPHLPFEGKAGWCEHVAQERFSIDTLGGNGNPFKIIYTHIKNRPCNGESIPSILASEKIAPLTNIDDVKQVIVEVDERAKHFAGTDEHCWNPDSKELADHSIPYVTASTLIYGTVTLRSYSDAQLQNPELHALMRKIEVVANKEFTKASEQFPGEHHARVTVVTHSGERLVGKTGGDKDDLSFPKSDAQIEEKFRGLADDLLGTKRVNSILNRLWNIQDIDNVAAIPPAFVLD